MNIGCTWWFLLYLPLVFTHFSCLVNAQLYDYDYEYSIANISTTWTNSPSAPHSVTSTDGSTVRAFLFGKSFFAGEQYACGFFCNGNCDTYLFAIFIVRTNSNFSHLYSSPQVVWSANGNNPVRINATLQLTSDGDLVLRDADGTLAWSTNTGKKSVAGLNLTDMGNLVLFDENNATVWQSFDHPTDSLVLGQKLVEGNKLTARVSKTNWTQGGLYSLSVTREGMFAFIESNPPQVYYNYVPYTGTKLSNEPSYIRFLNGSLALFIFSAEPSEPDKVIPIHVASSAQYMRLEPDGHLRVYEYGPGGDGREVADLIYLGGCSHPLACGHYGICSYGQCTCPASTSGGAAYFKPINDSQPDLGCSEITPLTCEASQYHSFLELKDVTYFTFSSDLENTNYFPFSSDHENTDLESCKQTCSKNCSCKAALFQYGSNSSDGYCYLPSQIFSLMDKGNTVYKSNAYIKVQNVRSAVTNNSQDALILGSSLVGFFGVFLVIGILFFFLRKSKDGDEADDYLDQVPGMPTRFSYKHLKALTENFSKLLGEGGFGSVFEGTLTDGTKVAVKRLDGLGQIKKSFLAEVETIGNIHHVNLVRMIGFCADKSHRLLVYEYMSNGSLDRWIFYKSYEFFLNWQQRKNIVLDIAKGLTYLHEECRQKIIHLDIKPQNILLDENFNAKVSDFGLSKLIARDQSQVVTTMRGTPGYMAPEWLSSVITEKVDVYSFGVVILEILCGRRNIDRSQPEEEMHLLSLFERKTKEERLLDLVDKNSEDMQLHGAEVVNMMRIAAWCLQSDFAKRPLMSVVVKVLDGVMDVEHNLDYSFSSPPLAKTIATAGYQETGHGSDTTLLPSVLSGPR